MNDCNKCVHGRCCRHRGRYSDLNRLGKIFARFAEKHGKVHIVLDVCCKFYETRKTEKTDENTCTPMV